MIGHSLLPMIAYWLVSALAILITAYVVPGFKVRSFGAACVASLVIGLLNWFIRPVLIFLTLPLNILTLGLFTFVVNAIILKIAAAVLKDFEIRGWFAAIIGAVILAIVGYFLHVLII